MKAHQAYDPEDPEGASFAELPDEVLSAYARTLLEDAARERSAPEQRDVDSVGLRGNDVPAARDGEASLGSLPVEVDGGTASLAGQAPVSGDAAGAQAEGVNPDAPGATLANGFKRGEAPGRRFRVSSSNMGVSLEKRNDESGSASAFFIGKDGALIDGDTIARNNASNVDRLWTPPSDEARVEAESILDEMGKLQLGDPKRAALKERLRGVVTGTQAQGVTAQQIKLPSTLAKSEDFPYGRGERAGSLYIMLAQPNGWTRGVRDTGWESDPLRETMLAELKAGKHGGLRNGQGHDDGMMSSFETRYEELLRERYAEQVNAEAATQPALSAPEPATAGQAADSPRGPGTPEVQAPALAEFSPAGSSTYSDDRGGFAGQQATQSPTETTADRAGQTAQTAAPSSPQASQSNVSVPSPQGTPVEGGGQPNVNPQQAARDEIQETRKDVKQVAQPTAFGRITVQAQTLDGPKSVNAKLYELPGYDGPQLAVATYKLRGKEGFRVYLPKSGMLLQDSNTVSTLEDTLKQAVGRVKQARANLAKQPAPQEPPKKPRSQMTSKELKAQEAGKVAGGKNYAKAYASLLNLKSTKILSDNGGRKLYEVQVSAAFSQKWSPGMGRRWPEADGLELKEKSEVTGRPQDAGYVLVDAREQKAERDRAAEQPTPQQQADLSGFTREDRGGGAFDLVDGNMRVRVEPTEKGKYQARFGSARSSPHLQGVEGAVAWAATYREDGSKSPAPPVEAAQQKVASRRARQPVPDFTDYAEAVRWLNNRSEAFPSKGAYKATPEFGVVRESQAALRALQGRLHQQARCGTGRGWHQGRRPRARVRGRRVPVAVHLYRHRHHARRRAVGEGRWRHDGLQQGPRVERQAGAVG